jgi:hypothetical protein
VPALATKAWRRLAAFQRMSKHQQMQAGSPGRVVHTNSISTFRAAEKIMKAADRTKVSLKLGKSPADG